MSTHVINAGRTRAPSNLDLADSPEVPVLRRFQTSVMRATDSGLQDVRYTNSDGRRVPGTYSLERTIDCRGLQPSELFSVAF